MRKNLADDVSTDIRNNLTYREMYLLFLVGSHMTDEEIANELCLDSRWVKTELERIFAKISIHSRLEAIDWAAKNVEYLRDPN